MTEHRPAYQFLPALSDEDYAALRDDIAERGVLIPVEYDEDGNVLDGHHRVRACEELGIDTWPKVTRTFATEADKKTHARQLNIARRHLNREQRRDLIEAELRDRPERSNRQIAAGLGVNHETVGSARERLEATGEIRQLDHTIGADGKSRPAQRPKVSAVDYGYDFKQAEDPAPSTPPSSPPENKHVRGTLGTGENEWYTPTEYLDAARNVLGTIDLDPASSDAAQEIVGASQHFTKANDGLLQEWHGRVWLNPPYTQPDIANFVTKMVSERAAGRVEAAILLTHNYTDTAWFHEAAAFSDAICFTRGRVKFYNAAGDVAAPTQGQAFFYFGDDISHFAERFLGIGFVVSCIAGATYG